MGRSVETVGNHVIYFDCSQFGYQPKLDEDDPDYDEDNCELNEDIAQMEFDDLKENIVCELSNKYKSLDKPQKEWLEYPYRETAVLLESYLARITISEYCGCGAICVIVNDHYEDEYGALAERWINQCSAGIRKIVGDYTTMLNRVGTFSNGCGVFEESPD